MVIPVCIIIDIYTGCFTNIARPVGCSEVAICPRRFFINLVQKLQRKIGIQISEPQFRIVRDKRWTLFHFFLSKTAMKYLRKHSTNCSWWILLVELYQNRSLEIRHQKDPSRSKSLARSRVSDTQQQIPSKLVDLSIKTRQKKVSMSGTRKSANFQNSESRKFASRSNSPWFKIVHFHAHWSDRVETFFALFLSLRWQG